ncbi:helix-turn-helix domain-containing protein [Neorhizobium sp. LjRoot104]|uniref:helix-turn-helix domain-containing protein n=1 Tax=Neorhizobium sp. LjRoot104 TaxID=3342254 RepID=UPI003ECC7013
MMKNSNSTAETIQVRDIGARLHAYRVGRGLSPEDLASQLGISRAALYRAEKGEIFKIDTLTKITSVLGVSLPSLLGIGMEYVDTAVAFFERMRQLEEESEQIIGFFGPISYLLTSPAYDEMLEEVLRDSDTDDKATRDAIERLLEILKQRKAAFQRRRPLLVNLIASSDLERFLLHGLIGRHDLPDEIQIRRRVLAKQETLHILKLLRAQPIGVQICIIPQTVPSTTFQIFRQSTRSVLAISPFRLGEQPNVRVGVGFITSSAEAISLHENIAKTLWEQSLKGNDAGDYLVKLIEKYGVE